MKNKDVEWLFNYIPIGTPVYIYGPLNDLDNNGVLAVGSRGTLVYLVQQRLKLAGFYSGQVNGIFNDELEKAIKNFQQNHNLTITGHGNQRLYLELGLLE
jgi:peptidoglycan hydrolase-like protein with peptidoglycan-binding domain